MLKPVALILLALAVAIAGFFIGMTHIDHLAWTLAGIAMELAGLAIIFSLAPAYRSR